MLRFSLRVAERKRLDINISVVQLRSDALETKLEKQGLDGVNIWINGTKDSRKEEERMATRRRKRLRYLIWLFNVPNKNFYSVIFLSRQFKSMSHACIMLFYCKGNHGAV